MTRNGNDFADRFPLVTAAIEELQVKSCIIDGEAIVCDDSGLAVFDLIRGHATNLSVSSFRCRCELPPFKVACEFTLRALDLATEGVAMLVRTQWIEGVGRYEQLFRDRPPSPPRRLCSIR